MEKWLGVKPIHLMSYYNVYSLSEVGLKSKRLYWHEFIIENRITVKSNGVPFVMMGRKVYDCHHGRDRNMALKQKAMLKRQEVNNYI